jgi:hypothetical protein
MRRKSTCLRMTSNGSAAPSPVKGGLERASEGGMGRWAGGGGWGTDLRAARDVGLVCAAACDGRRAGSRDKALAPMCQVNLASIAPIPPGGVSLAGSSRASARRRYRASGAGSRTRSGPGSPHGAADGTTSRSCFHCRAPPDKFRGDGCWRARYGCDGCGLAQRPAGSGPVRPRSRGASCAAARRTARPRSARPRCRTSPGGSPRS